MNAHRPGHRQSEGQRVVDRSFQQELRGRIRATQALKYVDDLVAVGDRFVGSEGDHLAADYIRAKFREWGLEVVDREFAALGYRHLNAGLRLLPDGRSLGVIPAYFSPGTPPEGVRGELVCVEGGDALDSAGADVQGKIAVLQAQELGVFYLGSLADHAARRGAVAMVTIHPLPWPYRASMEAGNSRLDNRFCSEQIPVACVSAIDGGQLMHAIGKGRAVAELVVKSEMPNVRSWNVSGVLRGTEWPEEQVLVLAHRDHGLYPGANDNGSGFGTMMEIAAALAGTRPRRSIEFLSTSAEEGTTLGVSAYIQSRAEHGTLGQIRAAINLDMIGTGGKLKLVELGLWPDAEPVPHTEWLMRWVESLAEELDYDIGRTTAPWGISDSGRFIQANVPAIWYWKPDDFHYHSAHDTVDKLDGNALKVVADLTTVALWQLANADELPRES